MQFYGCLIGHSAAWKKQSCFPFQNKFGHSFLSNLLTEGSFLKTSSPTFAVIMACNIPGVGFCNGITNQIYKHKCQKLEVKKTPIENFHLYRIKVLKLYKIDCTTILKYYFLAENN